MIYLRFQEKSKERGEYYDAYYKWMGINEESIYINKTLPGIRGVIKALFFILVQFLYGFGSVLVIK